MQVLMSLWSALIMNLMHLIQISIGKFIIKLLEDKFKATVLFETAIESTEKLITYWQEISGFLIER